MEKSQRVLYYAKISHRGKYGSQERLASAQAIKFKVLVGGTRFELFWFQENSVYHREEQFICISPIFKSQCLKTMLAAVCGV